MSLKDFRKTLADIDGSFLVSKERIKADNLSWKLLPRKIAAISKKFAEGEPISDAEILEYKKEWLSEDPLIDENGNPFVFYIHDFANSHWGKPNRVFHVAWCQTLERMDNNGRRARYVKKSDLNNNDFTVDYGNDKKGIESLPACINCRTKMQNIVAPSDLYYERNDMDVSKFFNLYGRQDLLDLNNPMYPVDYPENWSQISRSLRERADWECRACKKDFSNDKSNLHVHHKDGRRGVVHAGNLEVLCMDCHSTKFGHAHMRNSVFRAVSIASSSSSNLRSTLNEVDKSSSYVSKLAVSNISSSQRNKFDSFVANPDGYAIGSEKAKQKVLEVLQTHELIKKDLSKKEQGDFLEALKTYKRELRNKL